MVEPKQVQAGGIMEALVVISCPYDMNLGHLEIKGPFKKWRSKNF